MAVVLFLLLVSSTVAVGVLSIKECPPWFKCVNISDSCDYCICDRNLPKDVLCDQEEQRSSIRLGYCTFYDSAKDEVLGGLCMSLFPKSVINDKNIIPLPSNVSELNTFVCGSLNREVKGPLCGRCTGETGPSLYSVGNQCVPCSPVNVIYYLLLQYLPSTILFLVVILFRVNLTAAPMAHYVLFCTLCVFYCKFNLSFYTRLYGSDIPFISTLVKSVVTVTAVWSFDPLFFISPPLCVSRHMEDIYKPFLEFTATLYPFLLLLLTYAAIELHAHNFTPVVKLTKLVSRLPLRFYTTWEPNRSIIQAFSSLFFLSNSKLNIVMMMAFFPALVTNTDGKGQTPTVYIDQTVPFFATKHIILFTFSITVGLLLYFPPLLLLIVYPTSLYRKIRMKPTWRIAIKTYVETVQSCYKDGLNGTKDYRSISGYSLVLFGCVPVLLQAVIMKVLPQTYITKNFMPQFISIVLFTAMTILSSLLQPYKEKIANTSAITVLAILTALFALSTGLNNPEGNDVVRLMLITLILFPHLVFGCYIVRKMKLYVANNRHHNYEILRDNEGARGYFSALHNKLSVQCV